MRRVIDYINFKFLVVLFFFLNNQFVAAQELNSDTTSISTTPLVEESSLMWRDLRNVRDSMRSEMRDTRDELRDEISNMRDELRKEIYATVDSLPHELRIGWGDQIFESIVWRSGLYPTVLPEDYTIVNNENFRYIQHYYVEYQYNMNYWYSIGGMIDYSGVLWDEVTRNGQGKELKRNKNQMFNNIVIMPVIRFSYVRTEYVALYSSLGLGLNINTGTERDYKGRYTAVAPAINISLLGVTIGKGRCFGAFELGGMISLANTNEVYMLGSRFFTASVGVKL